MSLGVALEGVCVCVCVFIRLPRLQAIKHTHFKARAQGAKAEQTRCKIAAINCVSGSGLSFQGTRGLIRLVWG